MTLRVEFHPAAEDELDAAHDWYEQRSPGIGAEFVAELRRVSKRVADWPGAAPLVEGPDTSDEIRKSGLNRFPYGIVYFVDEDILWIVAVAHDRRRPGYWHDRLNR